MGVAAFRIEREASGPGLALSGDWTSLTLGDAASDIAPALAAETRRLPLDISALGRLDTAGAYATLRAAQPALDPAAVRQRPDVARLFDLVRPAVAREAAQAAGRPWIVDLLDRIGRAMAAFGHEAWRAAEFAGHLNVALARTIAPPRRLRAVPLAHAMETAGADALPIILVMNFFAILLAGRSASSFAA